MSIQLQLLGYHDYLNVHYNSAVLVIQEFVINLPKSTLCIDIPAL